MPETRESLYDVSENHRDADIKAILYPPPDRPSDFHDPHHGPWKAKAALARICRDARDQRDALEARVLELEEAIAADREWRRDHLVDLRDRALIQIGMDQPWPFRDAAQRLANFASQQLDRGYDGIGWEELLQAKAAVNETLAALATLAEDGE